MNTKIIKSILIVLCLLMASRGFAATVKITGTAPEYAQNSIDLTILHDFISEEKIKLATPRFNASGTFEVNFELEQISLCMADFDGYQGMIYLEPGKSYELLFPPKRTQTASEKKNPFFKPEPVWFGIKNPSNTDLNILIQKFEMAYSKYENKYFDQIFVHQSAAMADTMKKILDHEFPKTGYAFFESHKTFRKAGLEFALHQGKSAGFMESYFKTTKPVYQLGAYATLFNQVFFNYFNYLENTNRHPEVARLVNSGSLEPLDQYFQKHLNFNVELSHWALLKAIKDAYYNKNFSKTSVLKLLDQVVSSAWSGYEKETAKLIRDNLTYLASGTTPPAINLKDLSGNVIRLADYPNSYIYLHFTDPGNPICRQHLDALKKTAALYKGNIVIINILQNTGNFKNESGWPGIFTTTNSNVEKTYKVKTVPNSFLIGKDGKLLLSPAPNPMDGLDRQFGQIMKTEHLKEMQRSNGQKPR